MTVYQRMREKITSDQSKYARDRLDGKSRYVLEFIEMMEKEEFDTEITYKNKWELLKKRISEISKELPIMDLLRAMMQDIEEKEKKEIWPEYIYLIYNEKVYKYKKHSHNVYVCITHEPDDSNSFFSRDVFMTLEKIREHKYFFSEEEAKQYIIKKKIEWPESIYEIHDNKIYEYKKLDIDGENRIYLCCDYKSYLCYDRNLFVSVDEIKEENGYFLTEERAKQYLEGKKNIVKIILPSWIGESYYKNKVIMMRTAGGIWEKNILSGIKLIDRDKKIFIFIGIGGKWYEEISEICNSYLGRTPPCEKAINGEELSMYDLTSLPILG